MIGLAKALRSGVLKSLWDARAGRAGRRVVGGQTYDDFVAHINAKESPTTATWAGGGELPFGSVVTTGAALSGVMYGSSWVDSFWSFSAVCRVVQHAVSSEAQAVAIATNGRKCWLRFTNAGSAINPWYSTVRNGFTSSAEDDGYPDPGRYCNLIIWWDETLGARQRNPQGATAETAYVWI